MLLAGTINAPNDATTITIFKFCTTTTFNFIELCCECFVIVGAVLFYKQGAFSRPQTASKHHSSFVKIWRIKTRTYHAELTITRMLHSLWADTCTAISDDENKAKHNRTTRNTTANFCTTQNSTKSHQDLKLDNRFLH